MTETNPTYTTGSISINPNTPIYSPPNTPDVCPGCGRCRQCGQPYHRPSWSEPYITWTVTTIPYTTG